MGVAADLLQFANVCPDVVAITSDKGPDEQKCSRYIHVAVRSSFVTVDNSRLCSTLSYCCFDDLPRKDDVMSVVLSGVDRTTNHFGEQYFWHVIVQMCQVGSERRDRFLFPVQSSF